MTLDETAEIEVRVFDDPEAPPFRATGVVLAVCGLGMVLLDVLLKRAALDAMQHPERYSLSHWAKRLDFMSFLQKSRTAAVSRFYGVVEKMRFSKRSLRN